MALIGTVKPYQVQGPATLEIEFTTRNTIGPDTELRTGAEVIDSQTVRYKGKDVLEVWQRYRAK